MCKINNLKLLVIGNLSYPYGSAPTNRIHAYAKGIVENGFDVLVCCTGNPFNEYRVIDIKGCHEGVWYNYTSGKNVRSNNFWKRRWMKIIGLYGAIILIHKYKKKGERFAILQFATSFYQEIILFLFTRFIKIPVIREENEVPFFNRTNKFKDKVKVFIHDNIRIKLYDGIIVISYYLDNYFQNKIRQNAKSILIPILVDFNRFKNIEVKDKDLYIAYIGSMEGDKDGIEILLQSFAMISSKWNNYKLYLIGGASITRMNFLKSYVGKLNISQQVRFLGKVNKDKVPELLCNASLLTLARPDNLQAKGGFPTKLGEYLATGKPVVITAVGDIPLYLKDGYNAFLAEPDSVESFAKKMEYVLTHFKEAQKVGYNGRELAKNTFNYSSYKKELLEFINVLFTNKKS